MLKVKNKIGIHCILASLYFILLPLTITTNETGSSLLKIASAPIGAFFVISLVFYKKEFKINIVHLALAIYTLSTLITLFVANDRESLMMVLGYFLNAGLYIVISVVEYNEYELKFFENIQIVLLVIITVLTLFDNVTGEAERETLTILGQASDPNYFVGYFILPLTIALKRIFESKWRIFYIILSLTAMYAIFLSGSRGGMLAIIVTVFAFALIYPKGIHKKLMVMAILLGSILVLWIVLTPVLPENIIERMSIEAVIESRGTYRGDIWESMIDEITHSNQDVLFGRGIDAKHAMMIAGKINYVEAHNYFIQLLYNQGVVGLLLFLLLMGTAIGRCITKRKFVAVALIGMMALILSLSVNPSMKTLWNIIPYAAFSFAGSETKDNKALEGGHPNET